MRVILLAIFVTLSAIMTGVSAQPRYDSAVITRCSAASSNKKDTLATVTYFVNGDTLFMDKQFSFVHLIYSSRQTGKMYIDGKSDSPIVKERKGKWWYVILRRSKALAADAYLTMVVLRDYHYPNMSARRICADAYLYNDTKENGNAKTRIATSNMKKALKLINH